MLTHQKESPRRDCRPHNTCVSSLPRAASEKRKRVNFTKTQACAGDKRNKRQQ
ncbi:hypothetical protein YC2023_036330 [Brassica napus]